MRISTNQVFLNNIDNLSTANSQLFKTQQQISTGKQVLQPSDDPLASAQIIKLKKELARTDQFQGNIDVSNRRLALEETTLNQMFTGTVRLKELTIEAGNGALGTSDQAAIAAEVEQILDQMLGLMNTKDVQGEYIFSGFKGNTRTYEYDEATQRYVYQGDSGARYIQVGPDNRIASTDSGYQLFEQVAGVVVPQVSDAAGTLQSVYVTDFEGFSQLQGDYTLTLATDAAGVTTLNLTDSDGQPVYSDDDPPVLLTGLEVGSGDRIAFGGLETVIGTVPANGTSASATIGATTERGNILNVALELRNGLNNVDYSTADGKAALDQLLAKTLTALEGVQDSNIRARGSLGARMNALDQQSSVNEDYQLFTQETLSSFEDLDYNEALSRFALQQNVLQAAYSSFSQISGLSLFNYI